MTGSDGIPEPLPHRDELVRAVVAARWILSGDRGNPDSGPARIELCTRVLRIPGARHEARTGHRLRIRLGRSTRQIGLFEEPDTGASWVWDDFAPHELVPLVVGHDAADRSEDAFPIALVQSTATQTLPASPTPREYSSAELRILAQVDGLDLVDAVLQSAIVMVIGGLPADRVAVFLSWIRALPMLLDTLTCWDIFYGRADLEPEQIAHAARTLPLGGAELAIVGAIGGLAATCDESTLRTAVARIADTDAWLESLREPSR